jgi:hypothetical protein
MTDPLHELMVEVEDTAYHFVLYEREPMVLPEHLQYRVKFINIQDDTDVDGDVWVSVPHEVMEILRREGSWDVWLWGFKHAVTQMIQREMIELKLKD